MPVPNELFTMTEIVPNTYQATNWANEITISNLLKKGHYRANWTVSSPNLYIDAGSKLDNNGTIFVWDYQTPAYSSLSATPTWILLSNTGTFSTTTTDPVSDANWDELKQGWYSSTSRVVAYWNGTIVVEVNIKMGTQL